jgi:hypothetical protein
LLDLRVLETIERALTTGAPQKLAAVQRSRRPEPAQVELLDAVEEGELVGAHKPSEGR